MLLFFIYLSFISLGLPDALLGAAWPSMYGALGAPVSAAGLVTALIAVGTVLSSLLSDRVIARLGTGWVTAGSVALTALGLWGFSLSRTLAGLCLWALPYGIGAGSVDAALNNYVAVHYQSRHMSWLHCMWGLGASVGPYIMGWALRSARGYVGGYQTVALLQAGLTALLFCSLPLWKRGQGAKSAPALLSMRQAIALPGAKAALVAFFFYCSFEVSSGLWTATFLTIERGVSESTAAVMAALFYAGITAGRFVSGFLTLRLSDRHMIRLGFIVAALGVGALFFPTRGSACAAFLLLGVGCAPIYPCLVHLTPRRFGESASQALIGAQMAAAYVGTMLMPLLFGQACKAFGLSLLAPWLCVLLLLCILTHRVCCLQCKGGKSS